MTKSFNILFLKYNNRFILTLLFMSMVVMGIKAQNKADSLLLAELNEYLIDYDKENPIEKIYLYTSKDEVLQGDVLYYSIYNTLGISGIEKASKVVYVDLISPNNEIVASKAHYIELGRGSGSINIGKNLQLGTYQLRAYTNWMRNYDKDFFYQKRIKLLSNDVKSKPIDVFDSEIDFQFLPEGGNAIVGLNNRIAFRAVGIDGLSRNISGKVVDSKGDIISHIKTIDNGSGFFYLTPEPNESYAAVLDNGSVHPLDKIQETGYNIQIDNLDDNFIKIRVQATKEFRNDEFYIIGQHHQKINYKGSFGFKKKDRIIQVEIPKAILPKGVVTFTLFNKEKLPIIERAVFIEKQQDLVIETKVNKGFFKKRDKIQLDIIVKDSNGKPVKADLSLSVNDLDMLKKKELSSNIMTYLHLESDIRGYIDNPMRYFKDKTHPAKGQLDLLMLTHGWRKVLWEDNLEQKETEKLYAFEDSGNYNISGQAIGPDDKPLGFITVKMIAESKDNINFYEAETDNVGRFTIKNVTEKGDVKMSFRGFKKNKENAVVANITIDYKKLNANRPILDFIPKRKMKLIKNIDEKEAQQIAENRPLAFKSKSSMLDGILLDEVKIKKRKKVKKVSIPGSAPSAFGIEPDVRVFANPDLSISDPLLVLGQIAGINVTQKTYNGFIRSDVTMRGGGITWVIDGVPIRPPRVNPGESSPDWFNSPLEVIRSINPLDIERFEVFKGRMTPWTRGVGNVIAIYTKRGKLNKSADSSTHQFSRYDVYREFYSPNYAIKSIEHKSQITGRPYTGIRQLLQTKTEKPVLLFSTLILQKKYRSL